VQSPQRRSPTQAQVVVAFLLFPINWFSYSPYTEEAYVHWVRAFIRWRGLRHPVEMGDPAVEAYLTYLAGERSLAPASHRQTDAFLVLARAALSFLSGPPTGQKAAM